MSYVANRFTVVLDANVMYPSRKRDVLLSFYEAGLYRARWTHEILEEWTTRLSENLPDKKERVCALKTKLIQEFPEAFVSGHEGLADSLDLPDKDDKHVVAAAIRCGAQIIVADNGKHFPSESLQDLDIEVLSADAFLTETFDLFQFQALSVMREIRSRLNKPSYTPSEFIMDLTAKGMPLLASELRERVRFI